MKQLAVLLACICTLVTAGCEREARRFQAPASTTVAPRAATSTELPAGGPNGPQPTANPREENSYEVSQGKRLFGAYNCTGCHAHGGGAIGPALMDDKWIYGHEPADIFSTIVEGRPNGMPAFGGRIPESQVWQLVAYVRSMSGLLKSDVAPARNDDMQTGPAESRREKSQPVNSGAGPQ